MRYLNIHKTIHDSWQVSLSEFFSSSHYQSICSHLTNDAKTYTIFPSPDCIFRALSLAHKNTTKVVIVGQDPYHGLDQADGLAFSVPVGQKIPPSLRNIRQEVLSCYPDIVRDAHRGNLDNRAKQGVLLLNDTLTVRQGQPGSHADIGRSYCTDMILDQISSGDIPVVFLLWGSYAQSKISRIDTDKHYVLTTSHPSPLSAYRGFIGSKHFLLANQYLRRMHGMEIDWTI